MSDVKAEGMREQYAVRFAFSRNIEPTFGRDYAERIAAGDPLNRTVMVRMVSEWKEAE